MNTTIDLPYHFNPHGRTAVPTEHDRVRQMIEQVLFTAPGERVNRPTFGSGLLQLVFAPNGDVLSAATEVAVHAALQQWLADVIQVEQVSVRAEDSALHVTVVYSPLGSEQRQVAQFTRAM